MGSSVSGNLSMGARVLEQNMGIKRDWPGKGTVGNKAKEWERHHGEQMKEVGLESGPWRKREHEKWSEIGGAGCC
jgi:hypothetical protein